MPTNLYGPGDNYHSQNSHVIPALIRRFHEANAAGSKVAAVWGSGSPLREFLFVDDLAAACIFVMGLPKKEYAANTSPAAPHLNVGSGVEVSIRTVAEMIAKVVGYGGRIDFDVSKPDGTPRKLMDSNRLNTLGWRPNIDLETGLSIAYEEFVGANNRRRA